MVRRSAGLVLGLGIASTLLLAACGGGSANTSGGTSSAKTTGTKTATSSAGAGTNAAPGVVSGQDQLNLPFNAVVFNTQGSTLSSAGPSKITGSGFDYQGNTLNAKGVPTGQLPPVAIGSTQVHFWVPPLGPGKKSALQLADGIKPTSVTVKVQKPGPYKHIYLLEGAGNGPLDIQVTPTYSDGSQGKPVTVQIDDWCVLAVNGTPAPGAVPVLTAPSRLNDSGATATPACGMEGIGASFNSSGKTVTAITFGNVTLGPKNTQSPASASRANITAATLVQ